jgi:hypothetical protein
MAANPAYCLSGAEPGDDSRDGGRQALDFALPGIGMSSGGARARRGEISELGRAGGSAKCSGRRWPEFDQYFSELDG